MHSHNEIIWNFTASKSLHNAMFVFSRLTSFGSFALCAHVSYGSANGTFITKFLNNFFKHLFSKKKRNKNTRAKYFVCLFWIVTFIFFVHEVCVGVGRGSCYLNPVEVTISESETYSVCICLCQNITHDTTVFFLCINIQLYFMSKPVWLFTHLKELETTWKQSTLRYHESVPWWVTAPELW